MVQKTSSSSDTQNLPVENFSDNDSRSEDANATRDNENDDEFSDNNEEEDDDGGYCGFSDDDEGYYYDLNTGETYTKSEYHTECPALQWNEDAPHLIGEDLTQQSEASTSSARSSNSSNSSQKLANIISVIREQFKAIFDRVKDANDYTLDQMCNVVSADILRLGMGAIGKDIIKGFYNGNSIRSENLEKIGAWIDSHLHTTE
ncbi:11797_t:CDS:2 [Ambispora leptoticha]|uniref:11797_t:CDS:1 n=1 Tax=Ambispora leptoticha TaxID=144679 RepID=A0A9N8ZYJ2_9GLOM|nr:11797_t:CDS:2 [Ambispora leptoticha]